MSADAAVVVNTYRSRLDAELAAGLLTDAGIPSVVNSSEGLGLGPLPSGARLLVRREHLEAARQTLGLVAESDDGAEW